MTVPKRKKVCVIEGDDASPEVVRPTCEILEAMGLDIELVRPVAGQQAIEQHQTPFPDETKRTIDEADATLFGAASRASIPVLVYLRWGKDTYANVRPSRYLKGYSSPLKDPDGIDFVIVRENLEGLYPSREGDISVLAERFPDLKDITGASVKEAGPGKFAVRLITEKNTRRLARFACELTRRRKLKGSPGKLTCVTKSNMLFQSCGLFRKIVEETAAEYPDIAHEHFLVDDMARRIVMTPQDYDVVIMPNMFGDILADLAAGVIGGLGLTPSACMGDDYAFFEPVHGTAPDIAGKNIINPTAMILSAAMMVEYLGFEEDALRLEEAVQTVYGQGNDLTVDQGGSASTTDFCRAVQANLH